MATVKLLKEFRVSRPPRAAAVPTAVTLTHFDVFWLNLVPVRRLFFYAVPDLTTAHFTSAIVPALTSSLSLTLQHFFPLSGRLIVFASHQQLPYIRCTDADSVPLAICEAGLEFNHLAGDGGRRMEQVQALVPKFHPSLKVNDDDDNRREERPVLAVQVTVFQNSGFSIGVTYSHVTADGKAIVHFIKSWASICRSGEIDPNCLPVHKRDLISDPGGKLAAINVEVNLSSLNRPLPPPPLQSIDTAEIFRYTFSIGSSKVKDLKTWVTRKSTTRDPLKPLLRVSTFTVTCAAVWVCLLESQQPHETHADEEDETVSHFMFVADMRKMLNLPGNYFGNCLGQCIAEAKKKELVVGDDGGGVFEAAKSIGKAIKEREKQGMKGAEGWRKRGMQMLRSGEAITIAGSPKFEIYETDFGWGRPRKTEHAHIESSGSLAIAEGRSENGAVEFGFAFTVVQFQRFNHAFYHLFKVIK